MNKLMHWINGKQTTMCTHTLANVANHLRPITAGGSAIIAIRTLKTGVMISRSACRLALGYLKKSSIKEAMYD
jgi:hypothetical protein